MLLLQIFYTVRSGDTLSGIAARYGLSYISVAEMNDIAAPYRIYVGQSLRLKNSSSASIAASYASSNAGYTNSASIDCIATKYTNYTMTYCAYTCSTRDCSKHTSHVSSLRWVRPTAGPVT